MAENITAEQEVYEVDKLTLLDCKKIRLAKERIPKRSLQDLQARRTPAISHRAL